MLFRNVILYCHEKIKTERTINSIFHLLTGRRSVQTVQDSHLYQLQNFYGIYKHLEKATYEQVIADLRMSEYIAVESEEENTYTLTKKGKDFLRQVEPTIPFHYFSGAAFARQDEAFYNRLLLMIQVISNRLVDNKTYIPVIDNHVTAQWVKVEYTNVRENIHSYKDQLYFELKSLLSKMPQLLAEIFVDQLTAYKAYGLSVSQLTAKYKLTKESIHLLNTAIIHYMMQEITFKKSNYTVLSRYIPQVEQEKQLTNSADITHTYVKQGMSIEEIAEQRNLKLNTIQDHIVEIAYHDPYFAIDSFVTKEMENDIKQAIHRAKSSKLKDIKQFTAEEVNYFEIKLVMSTLHRMRAGE